MTDMLAWRISLLRFAAGVLSCNLCTAARADADELTSLWAELGSRDTVKVQRAIAALAARPKETVPFLQRHVKPVPRLCSHQLTRLILDLDSDQWKVRERSTQELERLGEAVEPFLRKVVSRPCSLEVRFRTRMLLRRFTEERLDPSPARLRREHAIEVLERIGDASARQLLVLLADGEPAAPLTIDARGAWERLTASTSNQR